MLNHDEADSVQRAVRGDRAALSALLERHQRRLYNVVLRMLGRPEDAADITQEALLKAAQRITDFHGRSSLGTWMVRIAMNLALTHLRRRRARPGAGLDESSADGAPPLYAAMAETRELGPPESVEKKEQAAQVLAALARLDDEMRAVLTLRDIDAMSYEDIAAVLGVPVGTVKSRLFRARLALRQEVLAGPMQLRASSPGSTAEEPRP